jgi:nucleotide-binding universal stress UspA family protein
MDLVRKELFPELRDFVQKTAKARASEMPAWDVVVLVGEPATEIVALAQREDADLIVIAAHGLSGDRRT